MKVTGKTTNPKEIEFEITIRGTAGEFEQLRERIAEQWPGWEVGRQISNIVSKATAHFTADEKN